MHLINSVGRSVVGLGLFFETAGVFSLECSWSPSATNARRNFLNTVTTTPIITGTTSTTAGDPVFAGVTSAVYEPKPNSLAGKVIVITALPQGLVSSLPNDWPRRVQRQYRRQDHLKRGRKGSAISTSVLEG